MGNKGQAGVEAHHQIHKKRRKKKTDIYISLDRLFKRMFNRLWQHSTECTSKDYLSVAVQ